LSVETSIDFPEADCERIITDNDQMGVFMVFGWYCVGRAEYDDFWHDEISLL